MAHPHWVGEDGWCAFECCFSVVDGGDAGKGISSGEEISCIWSGEGLEFVLASGGCVALGAVLEIRMAHGGGAAIPDEACISWTMACDAGERVFLVDRVRDGGWRGVKGAAGLPCGKYFGEIFLIETLSGSAWEVVAAELIEVSSPVVVGFPSAFMLV